MKPVEGPLFLRMNNPAQDRGGAKTTGVFGMLASGRRGQWHHLRPLCMRLLMELNNKLGRDSELHGGRALRQRHGRTRGPDGETHGLRADQMRSWMSEVGALTR